MLQARFELAALAYLNQICHSFSAYKYHTLTTELQELEHGLSFILIVSCMYFSCFLLIFFSTVTYCEILNFMDKNLLITLNTYAFLLFM